jgi:hypothetical protein
MAAVRTFTLPHYEAYPVQVALFKDVKNAEFLKSQLLAANPEFDYAFLDAAMVSEVLLSHAITNITRLLLLFVFDFLDCFLSPALAHHLNEHVLARMFLSLVVFKPCHVGASTTSCLISYTVVQPIIQSSHKQNPLSKLNTPHLHQTNPSSPRSSPPPTS